jgi:predicted GNAT superfamily acetyltransferase
VSGANVEPSVVIRDVELFSELPGIEALQREAWGCDDRDIVPATIFVATKEVGAILIGAFDGPSLVGFAYGFVGYEHGHMVHHSHMLAVRPSYRNFNLGYKLKLAQRDRALAQGITRMTWTFDPLQSLNAHFNFSKLGVLADRYKIDFYGEATSSFLHQTGTDRLWVTWLLDSDRVRGRVEGATNSAGRPAEFEGAARLVEVDEDGAPRSSTSADSLDGSFIVVEIPGDINAVQRENPGLALAWREATRRAFTESMGAGFVVEDFYNAPRGGRRVGAYLLGRALVQKG